MLPVSMERFSRQGNYTVLMLLLLGILFGFGALSIDVSMMRLAKSQAQDVADAASHAAALALRRSGDVQQARDSALDVIASNTILGYTPSMLNIDFGVWDENTREFSASTSPNASKVEVGCTGSGALELLLGPIFGWNTVDIRAQATSATKNLQTILVMDITGSWAQRDFVKARNAALAFYDTLEGNYGIQDQIGMVVFMNRFGWEYTPLTDISVAASNHALVRDKWAQLNVGSYAGEYQAGWDTGANLQAKHVACISYGTTNIWGGLPLANLCANASTPGCYQYALKNNFSVVGHEGGCFPNMPRYYLDEDGTDHTTGT
jgi:Flp pilus assembly protein TadG